MQKSDIFRKPVKDILTITEASDVMNLTRQAVYVAIKLNKLKAFKEEKSSRWMIRKEDLENHKRQRYCRSRSLYEGKPLYDEEAGEYSVANAAKILRFKTQKLYYLIRIGRIKSKIRGNAYIITKDDIERYRREKKKKRKKAMGE